MSELTETLAGMRRNLQRHEGLLEEEGAALLSAVEGVHALHVPKRVTWSSDPKYQVCTRCNNMWPCSTVQALTDALAGSDDTRKAGNDHG